MKIGVIDIGSNTFHLIIATITSNSFEVIFRKRIFVYLSRDGLNYISQDARKRAIDALADLKNYCNKHQVTKIEATATASLRTAENAPSIIDEVYSKFGFRIKVISGKEEAELIFQGSKLLTLDKAKRYLIMDIGGGSVELISVMENKAINHASYDIGISHLRRKFSNSDTISEAQKSKILSYLKDKINDFKDLNSKFQPEVLVGASGPFEIFENYRSLLPNPRGNQIRLDDIKAMIASTISMSLEERTALKFMPDNRADLAVESFLLIESVIAVFTDINSILVSPYAMKEGIISKYLDMSKK